MAAADFAAAQPFRPPAPGGRARVAPASSRRPAGRGAPRAGRHPPRLAAQAPAPPRDRAPAAGCASVTASQPRVFLPPVVFGGVVVVERTARVPLRPRLLARQPRLAGQRDPLPRGRVDGVHARLQRPRHEALVRGPSRAGSRSTGPRWSSRTARSRSWNSRSARWAGPLRAAGFPRRPARRLRADGRPGHQPRGEADPAGWSGRRERGAARSR